MTVHYFDIGRKAVHTTTWDEVFGATQRIQRFFHAVGLRFVEREAVLRKIMFAFMMREHVLLDGPTGSAKSDLIDTCIENIDGATIWQMDLTRFTTDTHLFGNYDVRTMREEGHMIHMTQGSLAEANFAKTGEFFDASDATLRTLLGVLNERRITRGPQLLQFPLLSVIADTNFNPHQLGAKRSHELEAVVDRFLFHTSTKYVEDPANRLTMLDVSLDGMARRAPLPSLSLADVVLVSGAVLATNLVKDPYIRQAYEQLTRVFSAKRVEEGRTPLSDRRFIKAAQILEVSALLQGRVTVTFDDMVATRHIICQTPEDEAIFDSLLEEINAEWVEKSNRREVDKEQLRLNQIMRIPEGAIERIPTMSTPEVKAIRNTLIEVAEELKGFQPMSIEIRSQRTQAITKLYEALAACDIRLIDALTETIPDMTDGLSGNQLRAVMQQAKSIEQELFEIRPTSDESILRHSQAREAVGRVIAAIQVEFMGKSGF